MENSNEGLFIDSNFFIALYNPSDNLHEKAKQISKQLQLDNPYIYFSNFIFLETVTILSQRVSRDHARAAGNKLLNTNSFIIVDKPLQKRSWEIFEKIDKKNVSFVDCSTLAIMEFENISLLLSFDRTDFNQLQNLYKFSFYNDEK
jgi:uncharacterized protein